MREAYSATTAQRLQAVFTLDVGGADQPFGCLEPAPTLPSLGAKAPPTTSDTP